jgi:hypothetical protein
MTMEYSNTKCADITEESLAIFCDKLVERMKDGAVKFMNSTYSIRPEEYKKLKEWSGEEEPAGSDYENYILRNL